MYCKLFIINNNNTIKKWTKLCTFTDFVVRHLLFTTIMYCNPNIMQRVYIHFLSMNIVIEVSESIIILTTDVCTSSCARLNTMLGSVVEFLNKKACIMKVFYLRELGPASFCFIRCLSAQLCIKENDR